VADADESLDRLEAKLRRLKREYELFLAGQGRGEPAALRAEVEQQILVLSRQPLHSTAARFRLTGLAHRFRALEAQVRNLTDQRSSRPREVADQEQEVAPDGFVVDRRALEDPSTVRRQLERFHQALSERLGGRSAPAAEALQERLFESARKLLDTQGTAAVRFRVTNGETGPKIKGEILRESEGGGGGK
jgi:hypothetical protein